MAGGQLTALGLAVGGAVAVLAVGGGVGGLAVAAVALLAVGLAALLRVALPRRGGVRPVAATKSQEKTPREIPPKTLFFPPTYSSGRKWVRANVRRRGGAYLCVAVWL